jgi:hypothetical protein
MKNDKEIAAQLSALMQHAAFIRHDDQVNAIVRQYVELIDRLYLRLRPSVGSFSLVSCSQTTPQIGRANLRHADDLKRELEDLQAGRRTLNGPGRRTPEKALQSWLISTALATGEVGAISTALQDGNRYWLVSDEIALQDSSDKFVADMLLVKETPQGAAHLVNVELKYERSMQTFAQVLKFREVLEKEDLICAWRKFAETMIGKKFNWGRSPQSSGLVIWPGLPAGRPTPSATINKMRDYDRIATLGYYPFLLALEQAEGNAGSPDGFGLSASL